MIQIGEQRDQLGESPVWSTSEQALYWVDIQGKLVRRFRQKTGEVTDFALPERPGSIALRSGGRLLVALESAIALFDPASGEIQRIAEPEKAHAQRRFNDGKCDRSGRFWVGTMNDVTRAAEGSLYRIAGQSSCTAHRSGIRIPNGLAFSPDGDVMYFADSDIGTIFRCGYDDATGTPGEMTEFARLPQPSLPDGATVDADGCLWSAEYDGGRLTRYRADGSIDRVVPLPLQKPTSCAFGGKNLDTLFVTTASHGFGPDALAQQPLAGRLLALDVGARGVPEPVFREGLS